MKFSNVQSGPWLKAPLLDTLLLMSLLLIFSKANKQRGNFLLRLMLVTPLLLQTFSNDLLNLLTSRGAGII